MGGKFSTSRPEPRYKMNTLWLPSELTYCTNAHPGENLQQVSEVISGPLSSVRKKRKLSSMGGGLWLSNSTALNLSTVESLNKFAEQLHQHGITVFTLNGFPTQGFHAQRVKEAVYHPDWSEPERLEYTIRLAHILAALLKDDVTEGTISSVPLGFTPDWSKSRNEKALDAVCHCLTELHKIHQQSDHHIRLCLEMEPGCVLESTDDLIPFFTSEIVEHFTSRDLNPKLIDDHLGICFDICHQAVMFEDCYESLQRIHDAGIHIGKIQISSALELTSPNDSDARNSLAGFIEQKYLHQSRCKDKNNKLLNVMDLDQAFNEFPDNQPWRTHFHVPVQARSLISTGLTTTQHEICQTLDFLRDNPQLHPHLEVETYTWTALPEKIRPSNNSMMIDGLTQELNWLENQMRSRNLLAE